MPMLNVCKRAAKPLLGTLLLASLTACDDRTLGQRVAESALGVIAIGVAEFLEGAPCKEGPRRVFVQEEDSLGGPPRTRLQSVYIRCDENGNSYVPRPGADDVGPAYDMPERAAYFLLRYLEAAAKGNVAALYAAGFSKEDVRQMAIYEMPSREGLRAFSKTLSLSEGTTRRVLKKMLRDGRRQAERASRG
jgi:hypothetical protein